ncbi:DUF6777 domain-containing protein [Actinomadura flavalba]|uniref:DUF6777 domain-containing protein n=1 Tax=Actinomadura flavalba TaxID=1120938 RepID=UPI00036C4D41|nr:DUF6777 domain-containing protein [Actinomadura flavalba]
MATALLVLPVAACESATAAITRLTVGSPGAAPYAALPGADRAAIARAPGGSARPGDTPGLYGGTRRRSRCVPARITAAVSADPARARAWAAAQGVDVPEIAAFVRRLTPVLLRTDTLVTDHGFRDGRPIRTITVLQAGIAVLVNDYGVPAVKCNSGNPLTPAPKSTNPKKASYTGTSWPEFGKATVTRILPREAHKGRVTVFVLVAPDGTAGFDRPAATTGAADGPPTTPPLVPPVTPPAAPGDPSVAPPPPAPPAPRTSAPVPPPALPTPDTRATPTPGPTAPPDPGPAPTPAPPPVENPLEPEPQATTTPARWDRLPTRLPRHVHRVRPLALPPGDGLSLLI